MINDKKFYWLKLKKDFFKRHDIQIIEAMPNGKDYILFYLKMLVESVDHEGSLKFNDTIPYNESMLSTITNTNLDIVRTAMKVFTELEMIEVLEDKTIYMTEVEKMLGNESYWAEQKRKQRIVGQCPQNVLDVSNVSNQEIEIDKELDIEIDKDKIVSTNVECSSKLQPIIIKWNSLNLSKILNVKNLRLKLLNTRIKDYGVDGVLKAIENITHSDFLVGQNNNSWVITFDWFIKPNNFVKVLEGNYTNKEVTNGFETNNQSNKGKWEGFKPKQPDFKPHTDKEIKDLGLI